MWFESTVTCNRAEGFPILLHALMGFEISGTQRSPPNIQLEDSLGVGKNAGTTCAPLFFLVCGTGAGCSGGRRGHRG